jgi:parallel beta-helix repeat protein
MDDVEGCGGQMPAFIRGSGTFDDPFGLRDLPRDDLRYCQLESPATDVLEPGDILYFRGGLYPLRTCPEIHPDGTDQNVYWMGYIRPARSGESGKPISFQAYLGESVTLQVESGNQPALGDVGKDFVRYKGFKVENSYVRVSGDGVEISHCEIVGKYVDTSDNHDGIRIEGCDGAWVHHSVIRGVQGKSQNSAGIKLYTTTNALIEDNHIYNNTAGIFDKDSGINNTYRRNFITGNTNVQFYGNNQGKYSVLFIYDNVVDGGISLHYHVRDSEIHDNLIRGKKLTGAWASDLLDIKVWNNIVVSGGEDITAFSDGKTACCSQLAYMDHNLYDAEPRYAFDYYKLPALSLQKMRERGFEQHSRLVANASEIFVDESSYVLRPEWKAFGRYGDAPGPENITLVLDTSRYGPSGNPTHQGDLNQDGILDILDVQACVNHVLGIQDWGEAADVNGDKKKDVLDVQNIVNLVIAR